MPTGRCERAAVAVTDSGIWYPGATIGHTSRVAPSAGGLRYEAFVERHIRQSKGRWRGQSLGFYPQQRAFHHELFRTEAGVRIYNEALYGVPRKNGKSTDAAALALYLLLADGEPAPEVYGAAGSRQQAKVILEEAKRMVRQSPVLDEWCTIRRNEIIVPSIDGVYRVVSAEAGLQMGSNPSAVIGDELHVWKGDQGRELYYALTTGMDAREHPLAIWLTTAGFDKDTICYEVFERGVDGEAGMLMYWLGARPKQPLDDPRVWLDANPAPWRTEALLRRRFLKLPISVFARLHLNVWTETESLWLPDGAFEKLSRDTLVPAERVWLGVDIGLRRDCSAVVAVAVRPGMNGKPRYIVRAWIFDPAEKGGVLDLAPIENLIRALGREYNVVECRYDPQFFQRSAEALSDQVRMIEVPASDQRMVPLSQLTYELVTGGDLLIDPRSHDGYAKHIRSAVVRETERGWRVSKAKSRERIDALIATMFALAGATDAPPIEPGARPLELRNEPTAGQREAHAASAGLRARARRAVERGSIVECTPDEYHAVVRDSLSAYAGELMDDGDEVRAQIALLEISRLDDKHGIR
jgi:phage terminase large subunit-like protein